MSSMTLVRPNFPYIYGSGFKQLRAATLAYLVFNALACDSIPGTNGARCSANQLCEPGLVCNENNLCAPTRDTADGNDTGADVPDLGEDAGLPMIADADVDSSVMDVGADIDSGVVDDMGGAPQPADECSEVFGLPCTAFNEAFIKASNTNVGDIFGGSVALSGDTLAVGAIGEDSIGIGVPSDNSARRSGAVYVFVRENQTWQFQAYIKASNAEADDEFGHAIALDGDTLVVGAPFEDSPSTGINNDQGNDDTTGGASGAVYVYVRANGIWSQEAYIKASNTGVSDFFGTSVAVNEDTIAIGAPREDSSAHGINGDENSGALPDSGAVYVFTRTNKTWAQQAYIKATNTDDFDLFGGAVALSGNTLAVGAVGEDTNQPGVNGNGQNDNSAPQSGAVYVFTRTGGEWTQEAFIKSSNPENFDGFGTSLTLSENTLAVGAPGEDSGFPEEQADNSASGSGAVYVLTRTTGVWTQEAYIKASNPSKDDAFGGHLDLSGNLLVVGAQLEASMTQGLNGEQNDGTPGSGAVYIFSRKTDVWGQIGYLKASNSEANDRFGFAVSIDGHTLAAGAILEDSGAILVDGDELDNTQTDSGAVYVRRLAPP